MPRDSAGTSYTVSGTRKHKVDAQGRTVFALTNAGNAVLVPLPKGVIEKALRSAVFDYSDSLLLCNIAARIRVHNGEVSLILSVRENLVTKTMLLSLQRAIQELNQRQSATQADCEALLSHLAPEGIEIPDNLKRNLPAKASNE